MESVTASNALRILLVNGMVASGYAYLTSRQPLLRKAAITALVALVCSALVLYQ